MIELGDRVRDKVTGYEGVVLAVMTCLYEATQYRVHTTTLKPDDGSRIAGEWIEAGRLDLIPLTPRLTGFALIGTREQS